MHGTTNPTKETTRMTARSPWRNSRLNVCFGEDLPRILRHHEHPKSWGLTRKWRPVTNTSHANKPEGGLWCAPVIEPEGKWRPIPRRSAWTEWCESEMPHWINGRWQTQLYPQRDAVFAVINSAADAVALYEAFPYDDHPVAVALREAGAPGTLFRNMIDWRRVLDRQIAGVWLTDEGQWATRFPDDGVPSLYGWDAATVWFSRPAFRIGRTWRSPRIDADPYDMGWDEAGDHVQESRERMREAAPRLRAGETVEEIFLADAADKGDGKEGEEEGR